MDDQELPVEHQVVRVSESREHFEGREDYLDLRHRLQDRHGRAQNEASVFLQKMREWGRGKIAVAWRQHFDSGDGELDFKEFCVGLASLGYKGNTAELWRQLSVTGSLRLEDLDPEHAAYLEAFANWCTRVRGGPVEVFREIDHDGSNSLKKHEFVAGLKDLGILSDPALPPGLRSEELLEENLCPLLVAGNCVNIDDLLFLEKDVEKRQQSILELQRIRDYGVQAGPGPLPNEGQRMLFRLSMSTTQLGGKHWKGVKCKMARGEGQMPYSPNFRPDTTWLEQIALSRLDRDREGLQSSLSLPSLRCTPQSAKRKKLKPLPPPVSVAELPLLCPAWEAWERRRRRPWPDPETSSQLPGRRVAVLSLAAAVCEENAKALEPHRWWLQLLWRRLLPLPAIFLLSPASDGWCPRASADEGYWDPAGLGDEPIMELMDVAHGQIALMCGICFSIEFLDDQLEQEEEMSLKYLKRRGVHSFPTKVQGRKYFPIPAPIRVRL